MIPRGFIRPFPFFNMCICFRSNRVSDVMTRAGYYYKKKQLLEQLSEELQKLETNQSVKKEMEFHNQLCGLLNAFDQSVSDAFDILKMIDPSVSEADGVAKGDAGDKSRLLKVYTNPHSGETVRAYGENHSVLRGVAKKIWR